MLIEDKDGNLHHTKWPIEALLDLFSPLPEDGYSQDINAREEEIKRRYGLNPDNGYDIEEVATYGNP